MTKVDPWSRELYVVPPVKIPTPTPTTALHLLSITPMPTNCNSFPIERVPFSFPFRCVLEWQSCFATCSNESALYMGLIGGNECACGNDESFLSSNKTEGSCTSACQGDAEQICGGSLEFSLYSIGNATCT